MHPSYRRERGCYYHHIVIITATTIIVAVVIFLSACANKLFAYSRSTKPSSRRLSSGASITRMTRLHPTTMIPTLGSAPPTSRNGIRSLCRSTRRCSLRLSWYHQRNCSDVILPLMLTFCPWLGCKLPRHQAPSRCWLQDCRQHDQEQDSRGDPQDIQYQ